MYVCFNVSVSQYSNRPSIVSIFRPKTFDRFEARTYVAPLSTMEWKKVRSKFNILQSKGTKLRRLALI